MKFSNMIWKKITYINEAILALPFNQELANGTLTKELFCYYIEQDANYLLDFAQSSLMEWHFWNDAYYKRSINTMTSKR